LISCKNVLVTLTQVLFYKQRFSRIFFGYDFISKLLVFIFKSVKDKYINFYISRYLVHLKLGHVLKCTYIYECGYLEFTHIFNDNVLLQLILTKFYSFFKRELTVRKDTDYHTTAFFVFRAILNFSIFRKAFTVKFSLFLT